MEGLRLVIPEPKYLEGYLQFCRELRASATESGLGKDPDTFDEWKYTIFAEYERNRLGIGMPENYVPSHELWLIDGEELIGRCSIRHWLTPTLRQFGGHIGYAICPSKWRQGYGERQLTLALAEAKKLGIDRALITCYDENVGSARVIEKNGGTLEDKIRIEGNERIVRRYWIDIP